MGGPGPLSDSLLSVIVQFKVFIGPQTEEVKAFVDFDAPVQVSG